MTENMLVLISADPKEDWDTGGEYHEPGSEHPPLENMAASLADLLQDATRHDAGSAWTVRSVTPLPVQPAGDGTVRVGTDLRSARSYGWLFTALVPAVGAIHVFSNRSHREGGLFPGAVVHHVPENAGRFESSTAQEALQAVTEAVLAADVTVFFTISPALAAAVRERGVSTWQG